jgi:DNA polymerase III sliding clamp (beta) subunit (PCNA family)
MHCILHPSVLSLCPLAEKSGSARFALSNIHLSTPNGHFRAQATNGKVAGIIRGPKGTTDSSDATALVGTKDLQNAFKAAKGPLEVTLQGQALIATGKGVTLTLETQDGRFPDVDGVVPKNAPLYTVHLDPRLLIDLLKAAMSVNSERVAFNVYTNNRPCTLTSTSDEGLAFDGLIVPLFVPRKETP